MNRVNISEALCKTIREFIGTDSCVGQRKESGKEKGKEE